MTIIDAYGLLNEYFNSNTSFNLIKNMRSVILVSEDEETSKAALLCALSEMEKAGILRSCEVEGQKYWILYRSLESFSQTIEISGLVAAGISSVINEMCSSLEAESEKCDPRNVTEKDLKNLIYMASKVSPDQMKK
jgi:hypothetical protein